MNKYFLKNYLKRHLKFPKLLKIFSLCKNYKFLLILINLSKTPIHLFVIPKSSVTFQHNRQHTNQATISTVTPPLSGF